MDLDNIIVPDDISVQSNEERIIIDPITRVINIPDDYVIGVESDEKSDRMYFQCPKIVGDNVDLSKLKLYVNFENANKERDNYFVNDVTVSEGNILFSWLFSRKVTKYKGDVKFIVCAKKSEDSLTLEWNTTVAKGLSLEGIEVELSDEEQSIASDYLIQLEKELSALAETENNRLLTTSSNQITNITNKGSEQVQLVENASKKALDSIPSTYTELQKQVDTIESVTNSSATGIVETTHTTNGYKYLGNSTEKPIKQIVIKGNTVQNSTKGLNLINCTAKTTTINGITMVNNRDGTYTVNGTATNDFDIAIAKYTMKQNIYYTLSGCPSGGSETTYYLDPRGYKYDTGSGLTIRNPKQDFSNYIRIVIKKDVTVNNLLFKPMFNEGQTAQPFEPYTGGKPSPSPEYPQEVRGVDKILATFKGNKSTLTKSLNHTLLKPLYRLSQNVYDYIDFNRGKIIRNVGVVTFDGSSDEQWQFASNRAKIDISNMKSLIYNDGHVYFCDKFKYNKNVYSDTSTEDGFITSGVALYIRKYDEFSKMSKNADVNKYFQSNPITVYYQLSTPTEEDIPSALLTQLQALQTYYPETFINFTSTVKPFVDLEYIVDTKHLIDSLYNTINRSLGINSIDNDVVGVQINYSAGTNTRLAGAIGLTPGASFDKFKMFGGRKRCNVADDGTILAYYGDDGYKEDGSNGQVMVYQPKVYYLILPLIYDKIDDVVGGYHLRKANYYVSLAERPGFKLHPAFINENGEEVDYILKSAFEGSIYDVSAGKYLTNDEQVMDATVDKLCSVANVKPCSGLTQSLTRDKVEQMAKNRGDGWHCSGIKDIALEQLLMMIELGSMNTQTNIGLGVVNVSDNTSYNCSALTGSTSSLGNTTGRATSTVVTKGTEKTTYTDDDKTSITYRGVENFWGNIWKFAEGVNFYGDGHQRGGQPYICKDFDYKEDFSSNNYEPAGFTLTNNNGYISAIGYNPNFDWLFFASERKGDSSTPVGDYLYSTPKLNDYRVALLGGRWFDGSRDGGFCLNCNDDVGTRHRAISGRLVYIPNLKNW
jgi:hypothetical protein